MPFEDEHVFTFINDSCNVFFYAHLAATCVVPATFLLRASRCHMRIPIPRTMYRYTVQTPTGPLTINTTYAQIDIRSQVVEYTRWLQDLINDQVQDEERFSYSVFRGYCEELSRIIDEGLSQASLRPDDIFCLRSNHEQLELTLLEGFVEDTTSIQQESLTEILERTRHFLYEHYNAEGILFTAQTPVYVPQQ